MFSDWVKKIIIKKNKFQHIAFNINLKCSTFYLISINMQLRVRNHNQYIHILLNYIFYIR